MDTVQWPQEIVVKPIEEIVIRNNTSTNCPIKQNVVVNSILERKIRAEKEQGLNCPRCNSTNTKFCYYNNYSLTQPRYFCKTCRRYWTEGGSLRNIPVGGGSRKNKKPSSSSSSSQPIIIPNKTLHLPQNPKITSTTTSTQDLNLFFPPSNLPEIAVVGGGNNPTVARSSSASASDVATLSPHHQPSAMELLTRMASNNNNNNNDSRGLNCFVPMSSSAVVLNPGSVYTVGFPDLQDQLFKSSLGFSLDGYGEASNGEGRLMQLPFEDLKQGSNGVVDDQQGKEEGGNHHNSSGYWSGMLGGGSW